jgi:hypothetical protein
VTSENSPSVSSVSSVSTPGADEWQERLQDAVAETLRRRDARRAEREQRAEERRIGVDRRNARKLARLDAAAVVDERGSRCRYLVSETPPTPCPNERAPGADFCSPHLTRAVQLARRLGFAPEGNRP